MAVGDFFAARILAIHADAALGKHEEGVAAVAFVDDDAFLFVGSGCAGCCQRSDGVGQAGCLHDDGWLAGCPSCVVLGVFLSGKWLDVALYGSRVGFLRYF